MEAMRVFILIFLEWRMVDAIPMGEVHEKTPHRKLFPTQGP